MTIRNEISVYNKSSPNDEGEVEIFDKIIFQNIIRKKEIAIISELVKNKNPDVVLDLGCGGGWLSRILSPKGYNVIGLDSSKKLINNATRADPISKFLVGNALRLPFKEDTFQLIIGVAVLHHLKITDALDECNRVLKRGGFILFMEPNSLNPLMALGRRVLPSTIHTEDERPIYFHKLKKELIELGFELQTVQYLFPYSFCISYLLGIVGSNKSVSLAKMIEPFVAKSENLFEKMPIINRMGSTIVVIAKKKGPNTYKKNIPNYDSKLLNPGVRTYMRSALIYFNKCLFNEKYLRGFCPAVFLLEMKNVKAFFRGRK